MKRSVYVAVLVLSMLLVLSSLYRPVMVYSQANLAQVEPGFPLPFVVSTQYTGVPSFPSFTFYKPYSATWFPTSN